MVLNLIAVTAGIALLVVAADAFVIGAARLAIRLSITPVIVGAVIIGFGTSSPELLVGVLAAADGQVELAMGSVVGSNAANLTFVAGVAALVTPLVVTSRVLRRELPLAVAAAAVLAGVLLVDPGRVGGVVLIGAFALALWAMLRHEGGADEAIGREAEEFSAADRRVVGSLPQDVGRLLGGLLGTLAGAQALVWGAERLADDAGLSSGFVGLTLVALGTSLPEVATVVQAARRGEGELVVGNVLGSCLFNGLAIAGIVALIAGTGAGDDIARVAAPATLVVTILAAISMGTGRTIRRAEGVALIATYVVLVALLAL